MTTIDIYARVSRASDKRDRSPASQVAECKLVLTERGFTVGAVHIDPSKSAWNRKVQRPGWEAMLTRLERGLADGVIVFELSRFARRVKEGLRLHDIAEGGALVMDSDNDYDLTTPKGRKHFRDAISDAEYESDMISARTKRGKRAKARDNQENNCSTRAFGFELGNVVPREPEAAELRAAAKKLLAGTNQAAICADLNARGVRTVLGNPWRPPSLRVALTRPANAGDVMHRGVVIHTGAHPGILDRDVYDQVVALYEGRHRGRPVKNLATGFVQCADCRRGMHAKDLSRRMTPYPDGSPVKAYLCIKRDGGCGQTIDWFDLDGYVKTVALARLADPATAAAIEAKAAADTDEGDRVQAQIAELEATAEVMGARLGSGQITLKRHDAVVGPLDEQLVKLYARQAQLQASAPARAAVRKLESLATWERRWAAGDVLARREIVRQAFDGHRLLVSAGPRLMPARLRCVWDVELGG